MKDMKDNLKSPCIQCPFKTDSARGWLGGVSAEDTYQTVANEGDFACHLTRHKTTSKMSRCKGSILFLKKMCKLPKYNKELLDSVRKVTYEDTKNILHFSEFNKYHTI